MKLTEETYVEEAERVIKALKGKKDKKQNPVPIVTTSKIRNLLAMTAELYNEALNCSKENLPEELVGRINYLKIRFVYEAGRENSVRNLVEEARILEHLNEVKGSRTQYLLFSRYMEALVAYRKFYVENDD